MKSTKLFAFVLLAVITVWAAPAFAQSDRGMITGTVKDQSGAVVPNAKITATNLDNGEVRETTSSDDGNYTLPELKAAPYKLSVEAAGFKTSTIDNIQIAVQVSRRADFSLEIGEISNVVTVAADTTVLQSDSPVQQLNVTERQVRELPLVVSAESGGRSPLSFIFLDSSVTPGADGGGSQGTNATNFRVNGGQGLGSEILIDGAATRRAENGTFFSEVAPGPNAFQEFTISTSNYAAEFGNSSGGVINFTIKSGGNDFHGEGYELFRNKALNANVDTLRLQDKPRRQDSQNDFGFAIGGPVRVPHIYNGKDRTFFFFNYGGYRLQQSESVDISVPTVKMRTGDFSELLTDPTVLGFFGGPVQIYDPRMTPGARNAIPGNRLDLYQGGAAIDPVGRALANLFPTPTSGGVFHNYQANTTAPSTTNYYVTKIDHVISSRQRLAFSYSYRKLISFKNTDDPNQPYPRFPEPFVANGRFNQIFKSQYYRLQYDITFTPTLLNHLNMGFSRSFVKNQNYTRGMQATSLGLPVNASQNLGLPLIGFPGYGDPVTSTDPRAYQGAGSTFFDNRDGDNAVQIDDFVTYVRGRHTFKFGAGVRKQQLNDANHFDIGGQFNFRSNQTANNNDFNQGWPIASLLTGATEFSFNSVQSIDPGLRFFEPSFFAQDDFKVTSRLTINLGVRYDIPYPRTEHLDKYRSFDPTKPNPAAGGRLGAIAGAAGQGGVQADYRGLVKPDYSNFGPRFGFAYTINNKTVVRGGYGLFYAPLIYNDFGRAGSAGYNAGQTNINGGLDANPDLFLRNFRSIPPVDPNSQAVGQLDTTVDYFDKNFKTGRTAEYSLDIQRELPSNFVLSLSYIGNKGTRLRSNFNPLNALPLDALKLGNALLRKRVDDLTTDDRNYAQSVGFTLPANGNAVYPGFSSAGGALAGTVSQALRPFPQYNRIINNGLESQGQSSYNALKIELNRRFTRGIQFGISYTFSKLITDAAEDLFGATPLSGVVQNPYDRKALRTVSPNSIPHSLVFNYLLEMPFGKGKRFLNQGGFVNKLVGGFQVTGVHRYRSGPSLVPFIAGGARDFLDLFGVPGNLRPNITGQPFYVTNTSAAGRSYQLLNPAAFSRPVDYGGTAAPIGSVEYRAYYANPTRFFGNSAPTYSNLRAQPFFTEDFSILKKTGLTESVTLELGAEFFNLFNRGRFGFPVLDFNSAADFGLSSRNGDINQPRRIQLRARVIF